MRALELLLAIGLSALPCAAQQGGALDPEGPELGGWSLRTWQLQPGERPSRQLRVGELSGSEAHAPAWITPGRFELAPPTGEELGEPRRGPGAVELGGFSLSYLALSEPEPASAARWRSLERMAFEGSEPGVLYFNELPGGIVFGSLVAMPVVEAAVRLELREAGLVLELDGRPHALPEADADWLLPCLRFAARQRPGHVLVDILHDGRVVLAPEFVDTAPGAALIRADLLPFARFRPRTGAKSVFIDREVRALFVPGEDRIELDAELEARYYVPGRPVLERLPALHVRTWRPDPAFHATDLAGAARVAAWVAFFRWALEADPGAFARLEPALAARLGEGITTARLIDPSTRREALPSEARIDPWMHAHRLRESRALGAELGGR